MARPPVTHMSERDYLEFDYANPGKHEFVNGEVLAMAGATEAHNQVTVNIVRALGSQLDGRPCRVYTGDTRVLIDETGMYAYPDLVVVCGERQFADTKPETLLNPLVPVEVLSDSTDAYDRGAKLQHYLRRATVACVLLIDSRSRRILRYDRGTSGTFNAPVQFSEGRVELPALSAHLDLDEVYAGAEESRGWGGE